MIDPTNAIPVPEPAAVQSTFNAWHVVALGVGAAVVHAYHTVVNAGGLKRIWLNFWNGPQGPQHNEDKTS
jgi:hypothetical protein